MKTISLTKGLKTIVDDDIFQAVGHLKWHASGGRAARKNDYSVLLHHVVVGYPLHGLEVDHINRNPLDNRRCNLRIVTRQENQNNLGVRRDNKAGVRGLFWDKAKRKWRLQYRHKHVKDFLTIRAAKKWLTEHYGHYLSRSEPVETQY